MSEERTPITNAMEAIASNLRTLGNPNVTAAMVQAVYDAWVNERAVPHGDVGQFIWRQFEAASTLTAPSRSIP